MGLCAKPRARANLRRQIRTLRTTNAFCVQRTIQASSNAKTFFDASGLDSVRPAKLRIRRHQPCWRLRMQRAIETTVCPESFRAEAIPRQTPRAIPRATRQCRAEGPIVGAYLGSRDVPESITSLPGDVQEILVREPMHHRRSFVRIASWMDWQMHVRRRSEKWRARRWRS